MTVADKEFTRTEVVKGVMTVIRCDGPQCQEEVAHGDVAAEKWLHVREFGPAGQGYYEAGNDFCSRECAVKFLRQVPVA